MTRDEIVTQVKLLLGHRTDLTSIIQAQISIQQNHLEREVKWERYPSFLLTERADTVLTIEDDRLQKPSDWIADVEEDGLYVIDSEGTEHLLTKTEYNKLRLTYGNDDPGLPQAYATMGDYYRVLPVPDVGYTMRMIYYQSQPLMSDVVTSNRWSINAANCLIGRVGLMLCGAEDNKRQQMFSALFLESKSALEVKAYEDIVTNRQYAMGENQ